MIVSIMQPYFFPYIGYFQLIKAADLFVVFDEVQYISHGWINRNRILSPNLEDEWQYIIVPILKHAEEEIISNIQINNSSAWHNSILGKLTYYKRIKAPYYSEVKNMFEKLLSSKHKYISELNLQALKAIFEYLEIEFNYVVSSKEEFDYSQVNGPGDWALEISKQINARKYINPMGGRELFSKKKFADAGIELSFLKPQDLDYKQSRREYVPWLSIIDVIMFNPVDRIKEFLDMYEFTTK